MSESSASAPGPAEFPDPDGTSGPGGAAGAAARGDNGQLARSATPSGGAVADGVSPEALESPESSEASAEGEPHAVRTARTLIVVLAVLCFALFWWVGRWLGIPQHRRFEASLLEQEGGGKALAIVMAALLFFGCAIAGHLIAGRRWLYAGPFVAMVGLAAWSFRGGPSRYVYFHAADVGQGRTIFLLLAAELAQLAGIVGIVWYTFTATARVIYFRSHPESAAAPGSGPMLGNRLQALGFQVLITAIGVAIFARVDAKKEVMAAVFLGSFVGASLTEHFFGKDDLEAWYWLGPALVGVLGYVLNYFANAAGAPDVTGHLAGLFSPLSRPLPLDYASAGMVGALLGFWTGGEHPEIAVGILMVHPYFLMRSARIGMAVKSPRA